MDDEIDRATPSRAAQVVEELLAVDADDRALALEARPVGRVFSIAQGIRLILDEAIAGRAPGFADESPKPERGRRERRSIWVSSELNDYLNFPGVGQVFAMRRSNPAIGAAGRPTASPA